MKRRKYWQCLTAMAMSSILICHVPITYAADQNSIEKDIEKDTAAQTETDIEADNNISNVLTEETDKADEIDQTNETGQIEEADETNEIDQTDEKNQINQTDEKAQIDQAEEKEQIDRTDVGDDHVLADTKAESLTIIPDIVDYMCNDDILFKFHNGTGNEAIEKITEVLIYECENASEEQKKDAVVTLDFEEDCFSYNLNKGVLILKNDVLKKSILIPGKSYFVEMHGNMMDGTPLEFKKSKDWIINYIDSSEFYLNEEEYDYVPEETGQTNPFSKIADIEDPSNEQHVLELTNTNTSLSAAEMENLIGINQTKDVVIHTNDGVTFTFLKNSMKMVEGKEVYDFGVELISDCQQAGVEMPNGDFVFRIKYNNTGELPGTAQVSIPVGSQWTGQEVFYVAIDDRGILYMSTEIVDANGIYTIPDLWFTL